MKHIVLLAEDISIPLDEGFKKASAAIASALRSIGIRVSCFTNRDFQDWQRLPPNRLLLGRSFTTKVRNLHPDTILYVPRSAATPMSLFRSYLLRRQIMKPVVLLSLQRRQHPHIARSLLKRFIPDLVLVLSHKSASDLEKLGAKVEQISLGVDLSKFKPTDEARKNELRKKYALGEGKLLLHVGHLTRRRNLEILIELARLKFQVVLVTSTSTSREISIMTEPDKSDIKLIKTYIQNVEEIYQAVDAYVFPTTHEKGAIEIPLSILEAMATNLPILTTPFGGIPDLFQNTPGLFFCHTLEDFKSSLEKLTIEGSRTRDAVSRYSWERVATDIVNSIERNLG